MKQFTPCRPPAKTFGVWGAIAVALLAVLVFSGCIQAINKFYFESDIVTDKRFVGRFASEAANGTAAEHSLVIEAGSNKHYVATFRERGHWVKLDAVFFRVGTNLFVDISRLDDNGPPHNPANAPTGLEILRVATHDTTHSVLHLRMTEDGFLLRFGLSPQTAGSLVQRSNLKFKMKGEGLIILQSSTEELRALLARVGGDETLFPQSSKWIRKEE